MDIQWNMNRWIGLGIIALLIVMILPQENIIADDGSNDTEYWALLVPVAIYADDPGQNRPLMFTEVEDFYHLLLESSMYEEDHIKVIKGEDATVNNILRGFQWLDDQEDENDRCVVYLTTHGFPLGYDIPPLDEADGTDEALVSFWGFAYDVCIITDDEINFYLNRLESEGVCMIVDSCYAGGFNDPPDWNKAPAEQMTTREWMEGFAAELSGQGRVVLMASCEDEVSYSGGFAPYVIDGMKGYADVNTDGIVSAEEVFNYAKPRTSYRQTPTIYDNYPGEFPLIEVTDHDNTQNEIDKNNPYHLRPRRTLVENATVQGYVTDEETGVAIEDATVELRTGNYWDGDWFYTQTDAEGFFSFNVEPDLMRLLVEKIGYFERRSIMFEPAENELFWANVTMVKHPDENSLIIGYVRDIDTGEPVPNVEVTVEWGDHRDRYWNTTTTSVDGFYSIDIAAGDIQIDFYHDDYMPKDTDDLSILADQNQWINETLKKRPEENALICGFVRDEHTNDPIEDARIDLEWRDTEGNWLDYHVYSDETGYYSSLLPAGEIYIYVQADDFYQEELGRNDASTNQTRFVNITLKPAIPEVDMESPLNAIYVHGNRIIPHQNCIIIGSIDVEAFVHDQWYQEEDQNVERVEFYLDDELVQTVDEAPFIWTWDTTSLGQHTITITVIDDQGHRDSCERMVTKYL